MGAFNIDFIKLFPNDPNISAVVVSKRGGFHYSACIRINLG